MAYVVRRPAGRWELRESHSTPRGPRSRTLAGFSSLDADAIARAQKRASTGLSAEELRRLAARAGAPVKGSAADEAAATLLKELDRGRPPSPARRRMLAAALAGAEEPNEGERAMAPWLAATAEERGAALVDLLDLADNLPQRRRAGASAFPRLRSRPA